MIGSKLSSTTKVMISLLITSGVLLVAFGGLGWYGWTQSGKLGVAAAAVASLLCWVSGMLSLGLMLLFRDPANAVSGLLLGMLFRMGIPLGAGVVLQNSHSELLKAGVLGMTVGMYLLGLCVETLCACWILESSASAAGTEMAKAS